MRPCPARGRSLVRLELDTGRTHQIRVHMASGLPLDRRFLYGYEDRSLISRPALHPPSCPSGSPSLGRSCPLPSPFRRIWRAC